MARMFASRRWPLLALCLAIRAALPRTFAAPSASAASESTWREAYQAELARNELLQQQLESLGKDASPEVPEACEVDWEGSYQKLAACNQQLEVAIYGERKSTEEVPKAAPLAFEVSLPASETKERVEVLGFRDPRKASFFAVKARLPLGLQLTKDAPNEPKNAFLVEAVAPEGAAAQSGVLAGDILHALTAVMDRSNLGIKTEDFVSSVVGGLGRWRQTIVDSSYINTVDDLVDQLKSNTMLGSDTEVLLIFERDVSALPEPAEPLEAVPK
ncbi:unnamed protein product [Effrenium voratum]|uniref:PDZ domain-containing protein n=1 Tax=Effrenium voratum TaxID=2562239 RepID=A0AA36JI42_9DINO|nr:unnamed protein product [Effrenium voratum]CAJ1405418.1 unnamed protein product [Effrenium voratum]